MNPANIIVSVQREDFCAVQQQRELLEIAAGSGRPQVGALASFVGLVRAESVAGVDKGDAGELGVSPAAISARAIDAARDDGVRMGQLLALEIEHYPAMTVPALRGICEQAFEKWQLITCCVIHRVGRIPLGEQIVLVMVAAAHRGEAFAACEYIMDYLKTAAPFWKKAVHERGEYWVSASERDAVKAAQW